jgi:hypothetical protein
MGMRLHRAAWIVALVAMAACRSMLGAAAAETSLVAQIRDPFIRAGVGAAISKNIIPAATQQYYPGFFAITADGQAYGDGTTWPGLDSWQLAGAYLLIGRTQMVLDYFEFVRASQRADGAIPMAIFPGSAKPVTYLRGLKSPQDIYSYVPPKREGVFRRPARRPIRG